MSNEPDYDSLWQEDPQPPNSNPRSEVINLSKFLGFSKTFWVNAAATVVAVVAALQNQEWVADHPQLVSALVAVLGAANVVLRLFTNSAVTLTPKSK